MKAALALVLCPAVIAVRLARVDPVDYTIAMEARGATRPSENPCRNLQTPKMCQEKPVMGKHTAAAVFSTYREDIHWLNEMPWSDNITVFVHDRSEKRTHETSAKKRKSSDSLFLAEDSEETVRELNPRRTHPIQFVTIPNKGDEAASYLVFIIEHYNHLPDVTFFLQSHRCADHANFDMATALPNIRQCFDPSHGYLDLNTYNHSANTACRSTHSLMETGKGGFNIEKFEETWTRLFQKELGHGAMPTKLCMDSFGQFAASRDAIRRHPVDFYKAVHHAVVSGVSSMEYFWRAIFVPDAVRWEELPKVDRFGKVIKKQYTFSEEELKENSRIVDQADQDRASHRDFRR